MDKKEIGAKLRAFREANKFKAKDVSQMLLDRFQLSIGYKTIYDYENGRTSPNIDVLMALCAIYGVKNPLIEFDNDGEVDDQVYYSSPYASAAGVGPWNDETLCGFDFSESEWQHLKKYAEFLIYCRGSKP